MRVKICKRYYDLAFSEIEDFGQCDAPHEAAKRIRIRHEHPDDREELDTTIHECVHAAQWWLDEDYVSEFAHDLAAILWRLGWRKTADGAT